MVKKCYKTIKENKKPFNELIRNYNVETLIHYRRLRVLFRCTIKFSINTNNVRMAEAKITSRKQIVYLSAAERGCG